MVIGEWLTSKRLRHRSVKPDVHAPELNGSHHVRGARPEMVQTSSTEMGRRMWRAQLRERIASASLFTTSFCRQNRGSALT